MVDHQLRSVINKLRRMVASHAGLHALSDAELLEAFLGHRDEAAFETLVWRHGSMVLNLCRRILHDEHQAEDAFQAVFLVFVRKAGSIGKCQSIASWLYKVASRVACHLRADLGKLPAEAVPMEDLPGSQPTDDLIWRDLRPVLDEEIGFLPEKYRSPIVLCYLQGHTTEEAAELLRCPQGTIKTHLSRGRELLKSRLMRRGLALPSGWLITELSVQASSAAMPEALVVSTVKAATEVAAGNVATEFVSNSVAALTKGVLHAMLIIKLRIAVAIVFAVAALCAGVGTLAQLALADCQFVWGADSDDALQVQQKKEQAPKQANQLECVINKVEGNKVFITKMEKGKMVNVTLTARDNVKVTGEAPPEIDIGGGALLDTATLKLRFDDMEFEFDQNFMIAIPKGIKSDVFKSGGIFLGKEGMSARITTDQNNNITEIHFKVQLYSGDPDGFQFEPDGIPFWEN